MPILKYYTPTSKVMLNGGGYNTTDWIVTGESGVAGLGDYWRIYSKNANKICSIVTGNGFTGNAQRCEAIPSGPAGDCRIYCPSVLLRIGRMYRISCKYRSDNPFCKFLQNLSPIGSFFGINIGDAIYIEYILTPTVDNCYTGIMNDALSNGQYFEFDEFNVEDLGYSFLSYSQPKRITVPNGGGDDTTDWVDSNSDGLADGWVETYADLSFASFSIVTGNGFAGNAQRYEITNTYNNQSIRTSSTTIFRANITYNIKLKVRFYMSNAPNARFSIYCSSGQSLYYLQGSVTGNAQQIDVNVTPNAAGSLNFYLFANGGTFTPGDYFEIDEIELTEIYNKGVLKTENITSEWSTLASIPSDTVYNGVTRLVYANDDYIYSGGVNLGNEFWRYSISEDSWAQMADAPTVFANYTSAVYTGDDHIFVSKGDNFKTFWRYTISTDTWDAMAESPYNFYVGHALAYDSGDDIYARQGFYKSIFRYSISGNSWYDWTLIAQAPVNLRRSHIIKIGDNLYLPEGGTTAFYRYSISENCWYRLKDCPYIIGPGSSMASQKNGYIHLFCGNDTKKFLRYNVSSNDWENLLDLPENVYWGGSLIYVNNYLYGRPGNGSLSFWKTRIV